MILAPPRALPRGKATPLPAHQRLVGDDPVAPAFAGALVAGEAYADSLHHFDEFHLDRSARRPFMDVESISVF
jgi:hypothetical protein